LGAAIFVLIAATDALAGEYGYIRAKVLPQRPGHHWTAQLYANGVAVGPTFSEAGSGFDWTPLEAQNLSKNPGGKTTPVFASYSNAEGADFQFDFEAEFSIDGQSVSAVVGRFHAPPNAPAGYIPVSLGCGEYATRLCSSDTHLQSRIVDQQNRKALDHYNQWKQAYDQEIAQRDASDQARAAKMVAQLSEAQLPDFASIERVLQEKIDQWNGETQRLIQEQEKLDRENGENQPDNAIQDLATSAEQTAQEQRLAQDAERIRESTVGSLALAIMGTDKKLNMAISGEKELLSDWKELYPDDREGIEAREKSIEDLQTLSREVTHGGIFMKIAELFVDAAENFLPSRIGTALKSCEFVIGREYCIGRELNFDERLHKACELAVQSATSWSSLKRSAESAAEGAVEHASINAIEGKVDNGICSQILPRPSHQ
jgi:hypothetical protein